MAQYYQDPSDYMGQGVDHYEALAYGATGHPAISKAKNGFFFKRGQRARLNVIPVLIAVFVPWIMFVTLLVMLSSYTHYEQPILTHSVLAGCVVLTFVAGAVALWNMRKKATHPEAYEPNWHCAIFILLLIALLLGVSAAETVYYTAFQPYFDTLNLATYKEVDPSVMRGQQLMDAGQIYFINESALDLTKAMSFTTFDRYCVAPIVKTGSNTSTPTFDFWAVGVNCCDKGTQPNYHCGQFSHPQAHSGFRLMSEDDRPFYRLAVQQSEAAFGITAAHPLFFHWVDDAAGEIEGYRIWGEKWVLIGILAHLLLQLFLVTSLSLVFTKLGHV